MDEQEREERTMSFIRMYIGYSEDNPCGFINDYSHVISNRLFRAQHRTALKYGEEEKVGDIAVMELEKIIFQGLMDLGNGAEFADAIYAPCTHGMEITREEVRNQVLNGWLRTFKGYLFTEEGTVKYDRRAYGSARILEMILEINPEFLMEGDVRFADQEKKELTERLGYFFREK